MPRRRVFLDVRLAPTIRERYAHGASYRDIRREYGIGMKTIWRIIYGKWDPEIRGRRARAPLSTGKIVGPAVAAGSGKTYSAPRSEPLENGAYDMVRRLIASERARIVDEIRSRLLQTLSEIK